MATGSGAVAVAALYWWRRHDQSDAVRQWRPSKLPGRRVGGLHVRTGGEDGPVFVLLHGLVATGDIFGEPYDVLAKQGTLVVPDLLGFGRSLDEERSAFTIDDHLDALDAVLVALGVADRPLVIGAHSMGGAIALAWAARLGAKFQSVVCWGAPVYLDGGGADEALADTGVMARLFAGNDRTARAACRLSCSNRTLSGWFAAAATPALPVSIARKASLHTWPAYRDAIEDVISATNWTGLAQELAANDTSIDMTWGREDPIGNQDEARSLVGVKVHTVDGADHHLPLTRPKFCVAQLVGASSSA